MGDGTVLGHDGLALDAFDYNTKTHMYNTDMKADYYKLGGKVAWTTWPTSGFHVHTDCTAHEEEHPTGLFVRTSIGRVWE